MIFRDGEIVTIDFKNLKSSNTFIIDKFEGNDKVLLSHPLSPGILIRKDLRELNTVSANLKDSAERSLNYASHNKELLDYLSNLDLEALCVWFVLHRKLTPRQKSILSSICGMIAAIHFNHDIDEARKFVCNNAGLLDDFNKKWFNLCSKLFLGEEPIVTKKQRSTIYNIAGFLLAELERVTTTK